MAIIKMHKAYRNKENGRENDRWAIWKFFGYGKMVILQNFSYDRTSATTEDLNRPK